MDFDVSTTFFYLKASIPVRDDAKIYAMFGLTNVELTGTLGGVSVSADDDDTGIGIGFEKAIDTYSILADYIIYNDNSGVDVSAINLGFSRHF